jgi:hypothetical protein
MPSAVHPLDPKIEEELEAEARAVGRFLDTSVELAIAERASDRDRDYVLSRYPVLKIHHTVARQMARKHTIMARLTSTLTSAIP